MFAGCAISISFSRVLSVAYIHQHSAERKKTADGDNGKGTPREVLVPLRVPLVDIMRQMEEDPTLLPEPDALSDPLATWMTRKYGADSSLAQLIVQVRQSQETDDEEGSSEEGADVLGLFVLLDGLDEAAVLRTTILSYLAALLAVEPCSFPLLTSRPGIVGFAEQESLATMGFVACLMSSLSQKASRELAASIMKRSRESEARMQKVVDTVADPVYAGLAGNPLCLTLLVHVLRKTEETDKAAKVLTKTAMYQQALKLMLHVADAAKFMSRDGQADMETIRQLEALKGPKARQLFQAIAWQETCMRQRTFTLAEAEAISSDKDTFEAFRSSIFSGRLPAFTVMEGAAGKQIQLAHLSFQELLAAEFATAVLQHSHKTCRVAPYWNFLSSSSVSCQSRDRLAEQWWLTVWINVSEMLGEDCFQAWCKEVGSDERALLKTGRICLHPNQMYFAGDDAYPQASVPHLVKSYRVTWIDSRAKLLKMEETKLKKQRNMIGMERKGETASMLSELMPLEAAHWICEGVGTLACFAVDHKQWSLVKALLAAGMHHCVCAAHCESVQTLCLRNPDWTGVHLLDDIKADINFPEPDCMDAHVLRMAVRYEHEEAIRVQTPSPAAIQLADSKADFAPSLQKACAGSLELELGELDLELMHPDTGITLLMCAAAGGCPDLVAALLKGRANVKSRSSENCTALHFALDCAWGEPANACVRLLLESRADPNAKCGVTTTSRNCGIGTGFMAGCMPAMASDMTKLDLLLEHGYDVTMTSDYGLSLLFWACLASSKNPNCAAMIQRLLDLKCSFMERLDTSANTRASNQEPFGIGLNRNLYRSKSTTLFTFLASGRFHLNDTVLQNLLECYDLNNRELVQERKGAVAVTVYRIPAWDAIQQSPALYVDDTRWVEHALAKGLDLTVDWIRIETNCLISHLMESTHLSIMLSLAFLTELPAPGSYFVVFSHVLKDLPDNKKDWPFEIKHFDKYVRAEIAGRTECMDSHCSVRLRLHVLVVVVLDRTQANTAYDKALSGLKPMALAAKHRAKAAGAKASAPAVRVRPKSPSFAKESPQLEHELSRALAAGDAERKHLQTHETECRVMQRQLLSCLKDNEELQHRIKAAEADKQQHEQELDSVRHENTSMQSQLEALRSEKLAILAHLNVAKQQRQALLHQSGAVAKEVQALRQRLAKSAEEDARQRSELKKLEDELQMLRSVGGDGGSIDRSSLSVAKDNSRKYPKGVGRAVPFLEVYTSPTSCPVELLRNEFTQNCFDGGHSGAVPGRQRSKGCGADSRAGFHHAGAYVDDELIIVDYHFGGRCRLLGRQGGASEGQDPVAGAEDCAGKEGAVFDAMGNLIGEAFNAAEEGEEEEENEEEEEMVEEFSFLLKVEGEDQTSLFEGGGGDGQELSP
ncbi:hypothetical protein AK812_SmicGene42604 [Symbiodinium microadriaticum]|uniref:Uncharacterized protein n=1 Tax=Symbiodinium microadriaticum TaxID=2951 RepID=A0A1Q9C347_SYMMI|nr:hypothetical protein AK812_SmicGene42604 [Symbiodinium microadriaticum]